MDAALLVRVIPLVAGFVGMTQHPVALDDLLKAHQDLVADIVGNMPAAHRRFLVSFKAGSPRWDLLGLDSIERLPAVSWKMRNLAKVAHDKRDILLARLREVLGTQE